jgi:DNA-binding CsgD family transcriptional regulator/tetratricopeptide (TPR) repeat protein
VVVRPILCGPFIGRLEELAYLRDRRLQAASSHGGLVFVAGDAGVGKSRLIAEFCASLSNSRWKVGTGSCLEVANRPYGPFLDALGRLGGAPFELGPVQTQHEQFDAIVQRFVALAARSALVLVIEDVHWADAATLELLAYFGTKLQRMRLLVLASLRTDSLLQGHHPGAALAKITRDARAARIDLAPLQGVELKRFIDEALCGAELPDETRRAVALAGDGNPFFTEELLKSALERSAAGVRVERGVPPTIRDILLQRLRPFDAEERRIVTQAAVIGRTFGLELLAATLETEAERLLPALHRARDFQLVEEVAPLVFRFRHGLTRESIYGGFLSAEARPHHRKIALALEASADPERSLEGLAYHWWAAGAEVEAARYNEAAGDAAVGVHAHEDAIAFYERVLGLANLEPGRRGSILEKIAEARIALGWSEEALATLGAAADAFQRAGSLDSEARCRVRAAVAAYALGLPNPTDPLSAMLARLEPSEGLARSRIHIGLAWLAASHWLPSQAQRHLDQVESTARAAAADVALRYHNIAAWVAMTFGDLPRFRSEYGAWVEAARLQSAPALASAYYNGATCFTQFGLYDEALHCLERALRIASEARSLHAEESAHAISAECYVMKGDLRAVRAAVEAVPHTTENRVNLRYVAGWGTLAGLHLDDPDLIARCFDGFEAVVLSDPAAETGAAFAEAMVRRGRGREAAEFLRRAMPDCELPRGHVLFFLAAGRHGAPAERARAREYLERAAKRPMELIERPALALFDAEACARAGRHLEARALSLEAAAGFKRLRTPLLEGAALELAGESDAALIVFERCGAVADVRRLASRVLPTGPPRAAIAEKFAELSKREREIADLAAAGRSNREIAGQLSIAQKTVEKHLASAYQKLGISSRAQLA